MCGIAGCVNLIGNTVPLEPVRAMTALMRHRGPDERRVWSSGAAALGAARLRIVDLSSGGSQPMTCSESGLTLVYNGEIYNHAALRQRLSSLGVEFRSRSDTEVVLQAWSKWKERSLEFFDGMYAFAVWDAQTQSLTIARDPLGIKPLYYMQSGSNVFFASEARALLIANPQMAEVREGALEEYLTFRDVAGEATLFRRIERLLPGQCLRWSGGSVLQVARTTWTSDPNGCRNTASVIEQSVRDQLIADVPVGTLCSGGIDSGLLTHFAARVSPKPVSTFSVSFPGSSFDESEHALAVARHTGTEHHVLAADPDRFAEDLLKIAGHCDEPMKYENTVLLYQVCALARDRGVIVLLSGEGADELFGGYPHFVSIHRLGRYRFWQRSPLSSLRPSLLPLPMRFRRAAYRFLADSDEVLMYAAAITASQHVESLLGRPLTGEFAYRRQLLAATRGHSLAERARLYDLQTYLPPILLRQDKASMAASVEARVPMLGREVVRHALSIRARDLVGKRGKVPLAKIAADVLPLSVVNRRKVGFSTPIDDWIRRSKKLRDVVAMIGDSSARVSTLLDQQFVRKAFEQHVDGSAQHGQLLWTVLALELWLRACCSASVVAAEETAIS